MRNNSYSTDTYFISAFALVMRLEVSKGVVLYPFGDARYYDQHAD